MKREINYIKKRCEYLRKLASVMENKEDAQVIVYVAEEIEFSLKIMQNNGKIPHEGERRLQWKK